ncbi:MAG TPA: septation protein SepH [Actinomycetota bacterium]|nr:septation protein SepH [Actinomycetota bacterium]
MERIHLVGRSADGERLVFARGGRDRTLFEVPITPELRTLVAPERGDDRGVAAAGDAGPPPTSHEHEDGHVRLFPTAPEAPPPRRRHGGLAPGALARATGLATPREGVGPRGVHALIGDGGTALAPPTPEPEPAREPERSADDPAGDAVIHTIRPRLTAGQIQAKLRAGRTIDEVTRLSGAPQDWVERLDATVQRERHVVVAQMLHEAARHPALGRAPVALGESLAAHLEHTGSSADALKEGWFAARPEEGGPWRVAWMLADGGVERRAEWRYDPRARLLEAADDLATELAWPPEERSGAAARPAEHP